MQCSEPRIMVIQPETVQGQRLIDANKMLAEELEAYQSAQMKTEDRLTRKVNYVVHEKIKRLILEALEDEITPSPQWIRCSLKLPDTEEKVLCLTKSKKGTYGYVLGYYTRDLGWVCGMNNNVVAWMPLPAPCEEGE